MEKKKYRVIIVDVDGTLYYQFPVRLCMAVVLGCYYLLHFYRFRDLFMLRDFRKNREEHGFTPGNLEEEQYRIVAEKWNVSEAYVKALTDRWMQQFPLKFLRRFRDRRLIDTINKLHKCGRMVVVYSDYPAKDKADSLGLQYDYVFSSVDRGIGCLKPDRRAMDSIMKTVGCRASEALMIGDRMEKDGKAAENVGMDCLILKQSPICRRRVKL